MVVALLSQDDSSASEDLLLDASAAREERLRVKGLQNSCKPLLLASSLSDKTNECRCDSLECECRHLGKLRLLLVRGLTQFSYLEEVHPPSRRSTNLLLKDAGTA